MLVCIGNVALVYRGVANRNSEDLDIVGSYHEVEKYCRSKGRLLSFIPAEKGKKIVAEVMSDNDKLIIEAEIAWKNSSAKELIEVVLSDPETIIKNNLLIPSVDFLYMLKMSHRYLRNSPFFLKTMDDIHYLRKLGAKINSRHQEFFKARKLATYDYAHPKLAVSKSEFFNGDGVHYIYDHDSIHEAVKHLDSPAYTYFKEPGSEVFCDKKLFFESPELTRYYAVLEEAYVLALERSQIPFRGQADSEYSFKTALTKVASSITSGWFREFAWENWHDIYNMRDVDYAEKFFKVADAGLVKLHQG